MKDIGARPHLGKDCRDHGKDDLMQVHGEPFAHFLRMREEHDPADRFVNEFTARLFQD